MINTKMIVIGVLFFLVANPRTYKLVNTLLSQVGLKGMIFSGGCASQTGVVIHAAIFTMLFCLLFSCFSIIEEGFIEGKEADASSAAVPELTAVRSGLPTSARSDSIKKAIARAKAEAAPVPVPQIMSDDEGDDEGEVNPNDEACDNAMRKVDTIRQMKNMWATL